MPAEENKKVLTSLEPLRDLQIVQQTTGAISGPDSLAVEFVTMMAAQWGAKVSVRANHAGSDDRAPYLPDGSSALGRFLSRRKIPVSSTTEVISNAWLVTNDSALANGWPTDRVVLILPQLATAGDGLVEQSELTVMAASGLLDIVAERGKPPLPMPGHQVAYATGLAAMVGLTAAWSQDRLKGIVERVTVSAMDVTTWLNWKNRLSDVSGNRQTGRDRKEEWITVPCRDGYIAVIFRDRDVPGMAELLAVEALNTPKFVQEKSRVENLDEFHRLVADALKGRSRSEVLEKAEAMGLQFSAVLEPKEIFDIPQMAERNFFIDESGLKFPRLPVVWQTAAKV